MAGRDDPDAPPPIEEIKGMEREADEAIRRLDDEGASLGAIANAGKVAGSILLSIVLAAAKGAAPAMRAAAERKARDYFGG